jgi:hypothetical protein
MKHKRIHHTKMEIHSKKTTVAQVAGFVLVTLLALGTVDFLIVNSNTSMLQADQTMGDHGSGET